MRFFQPLGRFLAKKFHLSLLTAGILLVILFFGLRPNTWPNINHISWSATGDGLHFRVPAFAYVDNLSAVRALDLRLGFSLCLGVGAVQQRPGFKPILMLHDGDDASQLTIAQWNSAIIAMNGDDYSHRRKLPRMTVDKVLAAGSMVMVGVISSPEGTKILANGSIVEERQSFTLTIPSAGDKLRMVLGNSVYGNHNWEGTLTRVALYGAPLTVPDLAATCSSGSAMASDPRLKLALVFDQSSGKTVKDLSGNGQTVILPPRPMALKHSFLQIPWPWFGFSWYFAVDVALNLFGFIPLGIALYARLRLSRSLSGWPTARTTIVLCFAISLLIEMSQGWLPNRTSSLLDLLLNTSGAAVGVVLIHANWQRLRRALVPYLSEN